MDCPVPSGRKDGLAPMMCPMPKALVLGSLPGDRSLALQEYYGHPQNRFWRVMAALCEEPMPTSYEIKREMLARAHIALWDVYASAHRPGSMDADIRDTAFNDLEGLLRQCPSIKTIALNGQKAASAFEAYCTRHQAAMTGPLQHIRVLKMPSTSPANARWTFDRLTAAWREMC